MGCTAIVGINWGDEGKGRMVDLLTEAFDVVVRFQGGGNVSHEVINQYAAFRGLPERRRERPGKRCGT